MKKRAWHSALFVVLCLTFGCLLLCSAPRLVASDEVRSASLPPAPLAGWFQAALSCLPSQQTIHAAQQPREERKIAADVCAHDHQRDITPIPITDANGNILIHYSYIRCVYQAFTLSDGFV